MYKEIAILKEKLINDIKDNKVTIKDTVYIKKRDNVITYYYFENTDNLDSLTVKELL